VDVNALLLDLFGRIPGIAAGAAAGLDDAQLTAAPGPGANTIAWLVWHSARIQDHHVAELMDQDQLWVTDGWSRRFERPADPSDTGYGHSPEDVASIRPDGAEVLLEYLGAVHARTVGFIESIDAAALDRIVDRRWDPPVTMGVRLISVAGDDLEHLGQAAYVRGLLAY
jgi:hypothetical protein